MTIPVHPQLMSPADNPEEFIAASIYWYPLIFPTRTEVLEHTLLVNGNGYEWGEDGNIHSVFAHIEPDYDRLDNYEQEARKAEEHGDLEWAAYERGELARLLVIRANYRHLARTYGPVQVTEQIPGSRDRRHRMITSRDMPWTLLGRVPENVTASWRTVVEETQALFAPILMEQGRLW